MHTTSQTNLDSYAEFDDSEIVEQLKTIGINRLKDLSEEAQLAKHRRWEEDLKQGHKRRGTQK
jgi:ABC-type uncharacterized transport system fused permease/ATPase subunit